MGFCGFGARHSHGSGSSRSVAYGGVDFKAWKKPKVGELCEIGVDRFCIGQDGMDWNGSRRKFGISQGCWMGKVS